MKILKIKLSIFSLLAVLAVSVFLTSCEQEIISDTLEDNMQEVVSLNIDQLPSKEIQLFDESMENSITVKVSTDNEDILALYTDQVFKVDFSEVGDRSFSTEESTEANSSDDLLHDLSEERIDVFIEVSGVNLRSNNMTFSIHTNIATNIALRNYNIQRWYKSDYYNGSTGLIVGCTWRGIDGLSAYGYDSVDDIFDPNSCYYIQTPHFSSKYFYNQNSGYKYFYRTHGSCLWVRTIGYYNDAVYYWN